MYIGQTAPSLEVSRRPAEGTDGPALPCSHDSVSRRDARSQKTGGKGRERLLLETRIRLPRLLRDLVDDLGGLANRLDEERLDTE